MSTEQQVTKLNAEIRRGWTFCERIKRWFHPCNHQRYSVFAGDYIPVIGRKCRDCGEYFEVTVHEYYK